MKFMGGTGRQFTGQGWKKGNSWQRLGAVGLWRVPSDGSTANGTLGETSAWRTIKTVPQEGNPDCKMVKELEASNPKDRKDDPLIQFPRQSKERIQTEKSQNHPLLLPFSHMPQSIQSTFGATFKIYSLSTYYSAPFCFQSGLSYCFVSPRL